MNTKYISLFAACCLMASLATAADRTTDRTNKGRVATAAAVLEGATAPTPGKLVKGGAGAGASALTVSRSVTTGAAASADAATVARSAAAAGAPASRRGPAGSDASDLFADDDRPGSPAGRAVSPSRSVHTLVGEEAVRARSPFDRAHHLEPGEIQKGLLLSGYGYTPEEAVVAAIKRAPVANSGGKTAKMRNPKETLQNLLVGAAPAIRTFTTTGVSAVTDYLYDALTARAERVISRDDFSDLKARAVELQAEVKARALADIARVEAQQAIVARAREALAVAEEAERTRQAEVLRHTAALAQAEADLAKIVTLMGSSVATEPVYTERAISASGVVGFRPKASLTYEQVKANLKPVADASAAGASAGAGRV